MTDLQNVWCVEDDPKPLLALRQQNPVTKSATVSFMNAKVNPVDFMPLAAGLRTIWSSAYER